MIRGQTIVCIANRWDFDPTSKHQVMKRLAAANDVVWVNYRGTRRPRATAADFRAVFSTLGRVAQGVQRVDRRMVQLTPLVLPGATNPLALAANRRLLAAQIRRAIRTVQRGRRRPVQVWTFAPDVWFLAGALNEDRLVYYCVDEYTEFEDFDRPSIRTAERRLIERADVVITTSGPLYESKRRLHGNTHLVRHGVDVDHFAQALDADLAVPVELADLRRPVLGFFGLIHYWIDCALLAAVARLRPAYSFVLIGDDQQSHAVLRAQPNVRLLGRRPYADLPAYCKAFDAGLLPFASNRMTRNVNPIKMREYLAAGLPVVSTPLPEAERYRPHITIADDAESFARACDEAVARSSPAERVARSRTVAGETWETVVEKLSEIVGGVEKKVQRQPLRTPALVPV